VCGGTDGTARAGMGSTRLRAAIVRSQPCCPTCSRLGRTLRSGSATICASGACRSARFSSSAFKRPFSASSFSDLFSKRSIFSTIDVMITRERFTESRSDSEYPITRTSPSWEPFGGSWQETEVDMALLSTFKA
jgi:hypothetical protein